MPSRANQKLRWIGGPSYPPYHTQITTLAPSYWWRLNDTSGSTAVDSAGSNTGTYHGSFTLNQTGPNLPGLQDKCVHWTDGGSESGNFISTALNPNIPGGANVTAVWWINQQTTTDTSCPWSGPFGHALLQPTNSSLTHITNNGTPAIGSTGFTVTAGWHMWAYSWNVSGSLGLVVVDGVALYNHSGTLTTNASSSTSWLFNDFTYGDINPTGMSNVSVWNSTALSLAQLQFLYNCAKFG